jgi:hypothetical protein
MSPNVAICERGDLDEGPPVTHNPQIQEEMTLVVRHPVFSFAVQMGKGDRRSV